MAARLALRCARSRRRCVVQRLGAGARRRWRSSSRTAPRCRCRPARTASSLWKRAEAKRRPALLVSPAAGPPSGSSVALSARGAARALARSSILAAFAGPIAEWPGAGPAHRQILYEMHIGTFTKEGTWTAATARLPRLADMGRDDARDHAGVGVRRDVRLGLRRRRHVRAVAAVRHAGRGTHVRRRGAPPRPRRHSRRRLQPLRTGGQLHRRLQPDVSRRRRRVGRSLQLRWPRRRGRARLHQRERGLLGRGVSLRRAAARRDAGDQRHVTRAHHLGAVARGARRRPARAPSSWSARASRRTRGC